MVIQKIVILICSAAGEEFILQQLNKFSEQQQLSPLQKSLLYGFMDNALYDINARRSIRMWENLALNPEMQGVAFIQQLVTEMEEKDFHYLQFGGVPLKVVLKGTFNTNLKESPFL